MVSVSYWGLKMWRSRWMSVNGWCPPKAKWCARALEQIDDLPRAKDAGDFDGRARRVWQYVTDNVVYRTDAAIQRKSDFWQLPAETLALESGDCEDCACLLASLLLASGISPFCVRVVLGSLEQEGSREGHAWTIYKDEAGEWRTLETTNGNHGRKMPSADRLASESSRLRYSPDLCFNQHHLWQITERHIPNVSAYVRRMRSDKPRHLICPAK